MHMANATVCSVEGCDRDSQARGWCPAHYHRWLKKGDPGPATFRRRSTVVEMLSTEGPFCGVEGCRRSIKGRLGRAGLCKAHYQRRLDSGEVGRARVTKQQPSQGCSVEGCKNPHATMGLCRPHYRRSRDNNGDPGGLDFYRPPLIPSYGAAHQRMKIQLGPARSFTCPCGKRASAWAYQYNDPDALVSETGLLYSPKMECYLPMCTSCHRLLDESKRARVRAIMSRAPGGLLA